MQHYRFHLNDYLSATVHLAYLEDLCYRRLLDVYYRIEGPLPDDRARLAAMIRIPESNEDGTLFRVLNEFFKFNGSTWSNSRCDEELQLYREWQEKSRKGAYASAEARRQKRGGDAERAMPDQAVLPTTTTTTNKEEEKRAQAPKPRFARPALEEVKAYCMERKNTIDAQKFIDYYDSKGWLIGRAPMKDWKAAIRTWERTSLTSQPSQSNPRGGPTQGPNAPRPCLSCGSTTRGGYWAPDGWRCHDHRHED